MRQDYLISSYVSKYIGDKEYSYVNFCNLDVIKKAKKLMEEYSKYTEEITVENNTKIEEIALIHYGSKDYWDFILLSNGIQSILELPVNSDILLKRVEERIERFKKHKLLLTEEEQRAEEGKILLREEEKNEKFRRLKIIKRNKLQEFIRRLKE